MVRLWCFPKPLTVVSERDEMSTFGEATALTPFYVFAVSWLLVPGPCVDATAASCPMGCTWVSADIASPSSFTRPPLICFRETEMDSVWL